LGSHEQEEELHAIQSSELRNMLVKSGWELTEEEEEQEEP